MYTLVFAAVMQYQYQQPNTMRISDRVREKAREAIASFAMQKLCIDIKMH